MAQVTLNIDAGERGALIGDRHYGIFFEEINHAGDGGLYGEMLMNRSFEEKVVPEGYTVENHALVPPKHIVNYWKQKPTIYSYRWGSDPFPGWEIVKNVQSVVEIILPNIL